MIEYQTDNPTQNGVYACRVENILLDYPYHTDVFLTWFDGRWCYMGSDQYFQSEVFGWIGPLQRTKSQ